MGRSVFVRQEDTLCTEIVAQGGLRGFYPPPADISEFKHLGIHERAIPPALEEVPEETFTPIQEAEAQDVAVKEISGGTPKEGKAAIETLLGCGVVGQKEVGRLA